MIKAIVSGSAGRMGKCIINAVAQTEGIELGAALEYSESPAIGQDASMLAGLGKSGVIIGSSVDDAFKAGDVIIEFSSPAATIAHLEAAVKHSKAMVIGTTGLAAADCAKIKEAGKKIPVVFAPNMSIGVNLLLDILPQMAKILSGYDVEIVEAHHHHKKDAPSGTALKLAQVIADALDRDLNKVANYGRQGITGERPKDEIGIHAVRAGDIVGKHTVLFAGPGESIEVIHNAHSRETFAQGAVKAAVFAAKSNAGYYDMQDVLGLK